MNNDEELSPPRGVTLVRYEDDHALVQRGSLIPLGLTKREMLAITTRPMQTLLVVGKVVAALFAMAVLGTQVWRVADESGFQFAAVVGAPAGPSVLVQNHFSERVGPPRFGPAPVFAERAYYELVRGEMVAQGATFIDLDLTTRELRYFKGGVLEQQDVLLKTPDTASWCYTPAGLYKVESVLPSHTSAYIEAVLPASVVFGANAFIHGVPYGVDGEEVSDNFTRDCLRLESASATELAKRVGPGTVVVVHDVARRPTQGFAYESKVPAFSTPYYLIGDLKSDTVLAVGDKHTAVPIASLTKLMTALVVLENLPLDRRLAIAELNLIESLVPRLSERSRVSVHTLLELLLVESSNEAAEVLAAAMGREKFIARMNERAASLGLIDTIFTDPSGLDAGNISSVHDLWWLTRYLYLNRPVIFTISENKAPLPKYVDDRYADLTNFNRVSAVDSFRGGKIGETEAARQTSVTIHRIPIGSTEQDVAIVLLRSEARQRDVITLLDYLAERFGG